MAASLVCTPPRRPTALQPSRGDPTSPSGGGTQWAALLIVADACRAGGAPPPPAQPAQPQCAAMRRPGPPPAAAQQPAAAAAVTQQQPSAGWTAVKVGPLSVAPRAAYGFSVHQKRPRQEEPEAQAQLAAVRVLRRRTGEQHCSPLQREGSGTPPVRTPTLAAAMPRQASAAALHGAEAGELAGSERLLRVLSSLLLPPAAPQPASRVAASPQASRCARLLQRSLCASRCVRS